MPISPICSTGSMKPGSTASAASNTSRWPARRRTRSANPGAERGQAGALECATARHRRFRAPPQAQGRHPPAGDHRRGSARRSARVGVNAPVPIDGAGLPHTAARRRSARSSPPRSIAPTNTICTGPRSPDSTSPASRDFSPGQQQDAQLRDDEHDIARRRKISNREDGRVLGRTAL